MARYNGLIIPRSYNDYYSRSDPQAIRDIVSLAADGELNAESKNPLQNQAIAKIVPVTASPDNKLIVQSQISGLTADVETIKNIIPNTASETNVLADKNFVNSTVGTNTANYIYKTESGGEKVPFSSVAELEAYAGTVTNNDYAFVTGIDENGNAYYDRYKADVNDGVVTWAKEYRLNNSSFTAEQWAAIQSGITAEKVAQFEGAASPVDVVQSGNMSAVTSNAVNGALAEYTAIPYLSFNPTNKVWAWHNYNKYNTSKPMVIGQLVAIFLENNLENTYWSSTTTGVVTYPLQNTNGEKSAKTKCIGIVLDDFIDILS